MAQAFPAEYQPKLFDRFFRIPGREPQGAGWDSPLPNKSYSPTAGSSVVNSTPGMGSEFYFDLPPANPGGIT